VFALQLADGRRRNFMVEIDRGTMPIFRSDLRQTSVARKMQTYLAAHATEQHRRQFGWRNFRVLIVTTDRTRLSAMIEAAQWLRAVADGGPALFLLGTFADFRDAGPLTQEWLTGDDSSILLM
jgi:hypothetical protein